MVTDISEDHAVLFLQAPGPMLGEALKIGKAWGFEYCTMATLERNESEKRLGDFLIEATYFLQVGRRFGSTISFSDLELNGAFVPAPVGNLIFELV